MVQIRFATAIEFPIKVKREYKFVSLFGEKETKMPKVAMKMEHKAKKKLTKKLK